MGEEDFAPCSLNRHGKCVVKVVLTGGPCAGKTTAIREIAQRVRQEYGDEWQVFTVAEASSFLYTGRIQRSFMDAHQIHQWQKDVLHTITQLESVYDNIAEHETQRHTMIVCDRGGLDPKAYTLGETSWTKILRDLKTSEDLLLARYHLVIQMHTAPKEYYSTENNPYRRENYQEAAQINDKYEKLWRRHPSFQQVPNFDANDQEYGWAMKSAQVFVHVRRIIEDASGCTT